MIKKYILLIGIMELVILHAYPQNSIWDMKTQYRVVNKTDESMQITWVSGAQSIDILTSNGGRMTIGGDSAGVITTNGTDMINLITVTSEVHDNFTAQIRNVADSSKPVVIAYEGPLATRQLTIKQ